MSSKEIFPIFFIISVFFIFSVSGCYLQKDYSYEGIRTEYAEILCTLEASETGAEEGATDCALYKPISLSDAIEIALKNNPDNKMAGARIRETKASLDLVESSFYPYIGFYTEYVKGDAPSSYLFKKIDQRTLPPNADFNDPGAIENFESGVFMRWNLFNGGKDYLGHKIAATEIRVSELDRLHLENQLVSTVIRAYYNTLAAQDFMKIANESVKTLQEQVRIMRIQYEGGSLLKSDVLSLEVRHSQAREDVVRTTNTWKTAKTSLAGLIGVSPDRDIQLDGNAEFPIEITEDYATGIAIGMKQRPEIERSREQLRQARIAIDISKSGYSPRVDLATKYYFDDENFEYESERENWNVALIMNWDIFTGFARPSSTRQASARLEQTLAADWKTFLTIKEDIKNAYYNLEGAKARLQVTKASVESAEESYKLVKNQFDGGGTSITRYLETEFHQNNARTRATAAFYDQMKALANLGRALGIWAKPESSPPETKNVLFQKD